MKHQGFYFVTFVLRSSFSSYLYIKMPLPPANVNHLLSIAVNTKYKCKRMNDNKRNRKKETDWAQLSFEQWQKSEYIGVIGVVMQVDKNKWNGNICFGTSKQEKQNKIKHIRYEEKKMCESEKIQCNNEFYVGTHLPLLSILNLPFTIWMHFKRTINRAKSNSFFLVACKKDFHHKKNQGDDMWNGKNAREKKTREGGKPKNACS